MNSTRIALVDDAVAVGELVAFRLEQELRLAVDVFHDVQSFIDASPPEGGWALAIIDLSFQQSRLAGLDALIHVYRTQPRTLRILYTQGDEYVMDRMRDIWEAIPLATVLSKSMSTTEFVKLISQVLRDGSAPIDPVIRPMLPAERSPWRSIDSYGRLIQHAGHAKLWRALAEAETEPSYRDLAVATGLSVNTVRNYRDQLLGELRLHGLDSPTMRTMQLFARRCRPFLQPFIDERLL
jgi:DNA-binding NarL/FixJ family response regulator